MTYIHGSEILTSLIQLQKMPHVLDGYMMTPNAGNYLPFRNTWVSSV
jgi:hypothetical protein